MRTGAHLTTRGKAYQLLERPAIQQVLAHPPTASAVRKNTGEVVELFEGGWLVLAEELPSVRVIVTRYLASSPDSPVKVGKRVGEWIYELFVTTLDAESFLVEDVVDLYHGRGAFETVFAEEDLEDDPDRWCSYTECGQELWQIAWKSGLEYPTDTVLLVVLWRLRYKLSLRDVAEMFLVRGFVFTHEAVRDWEARFAPLLADQLRTKRQGKAGTSWYVDETSIKVNGKWCYLYRAIDQNGNLVDSR
jgi:hypothetical protein